MIALLKALFFMVVSQGLAADVCHDGYDISRAEDDGIVFLQNGKARLTAKTPTGLVHAALTTMQFVNHQSSVCQGPRIDSISLNGMPAPYGEVIHYEAEVFQFVGGRHLMHALAYCANDTRCGGFSVDPDGACTYWHAAKNFSWTPTNSSQVGWSCIEKQVTSAVRALDVSSALTNFDIVSAAVDGKWLAGLHALNSVATKFEGANFHSRAGQLEATDMKVDNVANCHAQRIQKLNDEFGQAYLAPITWIVLPNGTSALNINHAEDTLQEYNQKIINEVKGFQKELSVDLVCRSLSNTLTSMALGCFHQKMRIRDASCLAV